MDGTVNDIQDRVRRTRIGEALCVKHIAIQEFAATQRTWVQRTEVDVSREILGRTTGGRMPLLTSLHLDMRTYKQPVLNNWLSLSVDDLRDRGLSWGRQFLRR